jgi:hypothetical protein
MKRLTVAALGVLMLIAASLSAQESKADWQKEFAGLRWGSTLAEIKAGQPKATCVRAGGPRPQSEDQGTVCTFPPQRGVCG